MALKELPAKLQLKSGSSAELEASNPVLLKGEACATLDPLNSPRIKVGDGVSPWSGLKYADEDVLALIGTKSTCDIYTATLAVESWSGEGLPYSQTINCDGVTASSTLFVGCMSDKSKYDNCGVSAISQTAGKLSFSAIYQKPDQPFQIFILIIK